MTKKKAPLPTMEDIVSFLNDNPGKVGKKEIARAFNIRGDDRVKLKEMLSEMKRSGQIEKSGLRGKKMIAADGLPEFCPSEITGTDSDGELVARPLNWNKETPCPQILITDTGRLRPAPKEGDRVVLKLESAGKRLFYGTVVRRLSAEPNRIVGIFDTTSGKGGRILSADRRIHLEYYVDAAQSKNAKNGDLVLAETASGFSKSKKAKIVEVLGNVKDPKSASLIALHMHGIPTRFTDAALKEAAKAKTPALENRTDLRDVPLVTIDGEDARDFDDAVFAEPDDDPKNEGGWKLLVAIADVAWFVRPFDALDKCARERGNSVYLPGMVIPMLPEALSNDLCSLRPKEKRPCLACLMDIDNDGNICRFDFKRAVMKSAARLTYREVQRAFEGTHSLQTMGLFKTVIQPLYEAYFALSKARKKRGTLELDPTEISIKVDNDGHILSLGPAEHFASHEIIEEFMIAANVSAAKRLEQTELPIMFRIHEKPLEEKLEDIEPLLHGLHLKLPDYPALQPGHFNHILEECRRHNLGSGINNLVLRLQCQAKYTPENVGHFGLALSDYVHFTSPIRRYADLLIHRALIKGCGMPDGGELESGANVPQFKEIGEHLCNTERTAVQAERDTLSRYLSAYLEPSIGAKFETKITGLTTAGIFVAIDSLGAEGLIPMHTLPSDKYQFSAGGNEMVGAKTGRRFMMGDRLTACLTEASPISGTLAFKLVESTEDEIRSAGKKQSSPKKSRRKAKQKLSKKERKEKIKQNNHQAEQKHNDE